jgi:cysteine sulfinate desulfinase/cysteine desulfurase-like protein
MVGDCCANAAAAAAGVRQPLQEIGQLCRQHKVFLHTDAAQVRGARGVC